MGINGGKASSAIGGKTARACDSCLIKRARWFCAADDAFLCQSCDGAVHSANQLASRHDRVRLETASCKASPAPAPAWHTKKARTPRNAKASRPPAANHHHQLPVVPELGSEDPFPPEETDEQLFCRVPEFDGEFCTEMVKGEELGFEMGLVFDDDRELNLDELLSSCDDDFAADVETLLGTGISDCGGIDGLLDEKTVKIEENRDEIDEEIARHFDPELDAELNWDFDCTTNSPIGDSETAKSGSNNTETESEKSKQLLQLNYEAVIAAWANQSSTSPWADGTRPQFDLDEFMSGCSSYEEEWGGKGRRERDAGREARVSRYREKRRTRLFSKKIRYEVRKLNAEKRPRMKGRFVKRTTFLGSSSLPYQHQHQHLINK